MALYLEIQEPLLACKLSSASLLSVTCGESISATCRGGDGITGSAGTTEFWSAVIVTLFACKCHSQLQLLALQYD